MVDEEKSIYNKTTSSNNKLKCNNGNLITSMSFPRRYIAAADAKPGESCEFGTPKYFLYCALGGILSCGITHTAVVPLDLVKCRIQVDPDKYKGVVQGFKVSLAEEGLKGLAKGWAPTFIGYSIQGLGKFGLYETFKVSYSSFIGEENSYLWRTSLYLAASASAEFFADIGLAPFEACKVKMQTSPGYAGTLRECFPKLLETEGSIKNTNILTSDQFFILLFVIIF